MSPLRILLGLRMMQVGVTTGAIQLFQSKRQPQQTNTQLLQAGCFSVNQQCLYQHTEGYWCQRADEMLGNPPPQGNQEPLVVKTRLKDPPGELAVSRSVECDIFSKGCPSVNIFRMQPLAH